MLLRLLPPVFPPVLIYTSLSLTLSEAKWNEAATDGKVSKEVWEKWVADETVAANAEAAAGEIVAAVDTSGGSVVWV